MLNKRGQGLSTNAIILIILGIVILVVLIIGFTLGWSSISPYFSSDNVDTIVSQCQAACTTMSTYDFCTKQRDLDDGTNEYTATCYSFSIGDEFESYSIDSCSALGCSSSVSCSSLNYTDSDGNSVQITIGGESPDSPYCVSS